MSTYVFDQAWKKERDRLTALESLSDGVTCRLLDQIGVGPGWRCLEVGCGAGSIARWLADQVGETGHVLATDLDTRFLDGHDRVNLEVRTHNIVTDPIDEAAFDLIHARAVLVHLPDRKRVLNRLVAALRAGGWLVIEDVDFAGATAGMLGKYVTAPQPAGAAMERIYLAAAEVFSANGAEPSYGAQLTSAMAGAGLGSVAAQLHAPVVAGGGEQWIRGTVEQLAERLVATGVTTAADIEWFLRASNEPGIYYLVAPIVSAWGRRDGLQS